MWLKFVFPGITLSIRKHDGLFWPLSSGLRINHAENLKIVHFAQTRPTFISQKNTRNFQNFNILTVFFPKILSKVIFLLSLKIFRKTYNMSYRS